MVCMTASHIAPNQVGQRQRAHRVIATERHSLVDFRRAGILLREHKESLVDHRQQNALTRNPDPPLTLIADLPSWSASASAISCVASVVCKLRTISTSAM